MSLDSRRFRHASVPGAAARGGSRCRLPRAAAADHLDVWFSPAYTAPLRLEHARSVVAIHDLSFVAHPSGFASARAARRRWLTSASAARAAAVLITISQFSKRELIDRLDVPADEDPRHSAGHRSGGSQLGPTPGQSGAPAAPARQACCTWVPSSTAGT